MSVNALQAVLDRAAQQTAPDKADARETARPAAAMSGSGSRNRSKPAKAIQPREEPADQSKSYRPVRDGKRFVGAHFHPEVARQLKVLAAEDGTTIQDLLEQAVDLLFVKSGRTKIAELIRKG